MLRKMLIGASSALVMLLILSNASMASLTVKIPATGQGLTTAGQQDPNWTIGVVGSDPAPAQLLTPSANNWTPDWLPNGPESSWIGVTADQTNNGSFYSYRTTFDLSSFVLSTVSISMKWAVDDGGFLFVNGIPVSNLAPGNWNYLTSVDIAAGSRALLPGLNTISIFMTNTDNYIEGARLEGSITGAQSPIPAAAVLLGSGICGLVLFRRKRVS